MHVSQSRRSKVDYIRSAKRGGKWQLALSPNKIHGAHKYIKMTH